VKKDVGLRVYLSIERNATKKSIYLMALVYSITSVQNQCIQIDSVNTAMRPSTFGLIANGSASDLPASLLNFVAAINTVPWEVKEDHHRMTRSSVNKFLMIVGSGGNESASCNTVAPSKALS
jgi:hypothetical protein